jgi:hypothetical protein
MVRFRRLLHRGRSRGRSGGHRSGGHRSGRHHRRSGFLLRFRADGAEVLTNLVRNLVLERAGVRPLIGDPQFGKAVQNRFAFDLELTRQIINPNLAHFPSFSFPAQCRDR